MSDQSRISLRQRLLLRTEQRYLDFSLPGPLRSSLARLEERLYGRPAATLPIERPIFIVGCHRSGTTVLYEILARHPDLVYFTNASSLVPDSPILMNRLLDLVGEAKQPVERFSQDGLTITHRTPSEGIRIWEHLLPEGDSYYLDESYDDIKLERYLRSTIQKHLKYFKGRRFINKNPDNSVRMRYLNKLFPDAYFINIVRDGRAVCHSLLKFRRTATEFFGADHRHATSGVKVPGWPRIETVWNSDPVRSVGLLWCAVMDAIERDRAHLPPERYRQVIFEDFVAHPMEHIRSLAAWCDLPWTAEIERLYQEEGRRVNMGGRNDQWKTYFTPDDLELLMPIIAPTMRRYGYEVAA